MEFQNKRAALWQVLALGSVLALSGCGDSSSDSVSDSSSIEGSIFAAAVEGAEVSVLDVNGNLLAGPVMTGSDGGYRINIPNAHLSGDLQFVSSGGTFVDEASGQGTNAAEMSAYVAGGTLASGDEVHATPGSTILHQLVVQHGLTLSEAQQAFANAFSFTPDFAVAPTNATAPGLDASDEEKLAGFRAAVMSQLALDLGLTAQQQFALMQALAEDLADGELDGQGSRGNVMIPGSAEPLAADVASRYALAMENFRSGNDNSGLNPTQIGTVPFARFAHSKNYRFEYVDGMMTAMEGKTEFKLRVRHLADGSAASGLTLSLMSKMNMAMHTHSTPIPGNACTEEGVTGDYNCTIYYLMPSEMAGVNMGYWMLNVMAGMDDSVTFYPSVMMGMNGNGRHQLKGVDDMLSDMTGSLSARPYFLFKDNVNATMSGHDVTLFVATKESMMSFPALTTGMTLNSGSMTSQLDVTSVDLQLSTDRMNWSSATENGNGYYTVSGLSGLSNGTVGHVYMKLRVNGELKTTNGELSNEGACEDPLVTEGAALCNHYSTLMFTPSASMEM